MSGCSDLFGAWEQGRGIRADRARTSPQQIFADADTVAAVRVAEGRSSLWSADVRAWSCRHHRVPASNPDCGTLTTELKGQTLANPSWPPLPLADWQATLDTLHMWTTRMRRLRSKS